MSYYPDGDSKADSYGERIDELQAELAEANAENERLKAEVERLRATAMLGDMLLDLIHDMSDCLPTDSKTDAFIDVWLKQRSRITAMQRQIEDEGRPATESIQTLLS